MILVLDGYNVVHALRDFEKHLDQSLKAARDRLILACRDLAGKRGDIEKILIVFDGSSEYSFYPPEQFPGVEIIYTETGEDADDRIIVLLESLRQRTVKVVSNDNYVSNHARAYGADALSAKEFYAFARKIRGGKPEKETSARGDLPGDKAREITEEYKRYLGLE